ncbi:MAG: hypothetical protein AMS27_17640 [Bacteroides sp. SM23_62_1]|nr:MAG: hypothetical protein AMS27_17640 [Bacteroides sp. SM23_62_1]
MSNNSFQFKQFIIKQDRTVFKVGTDGVLLGSWVNISSVKKVLDIGTGTGLIALMLAQRTKAEIHAVETDDASFLQAGENIRESPWPERISLFHSSFQDFARSNQAKYDLIVTNPPYFFDAIKSADDAKSMSRHHVRLSFHEILTGVSEVLEQSGLFALILPVIEGKIFLSLANSYGFFLKRKTDVIPVAGKKAIRYLMEFTREKEHSIQENELIVHHHTNREFTKDYRELTKDFYLCF